MSEKDYNQTDRKPKRRRCHICGNVEPIGGDGKMHRFLSVAKDVWECSYCSNQGN